MRGRRTSASTLTIAFALGIAVVAGAGLPAAASAGARTAASTTTSVSTAARTAASITTSVSTAGGPAATGGRPWTLAGHRCRLVATGRPTESLSPLAGGETCPGVRPGSSVLTPIGQCTLNFLWRATDGRDYIGTAGHCLLEGTNVTRAVFPPGEGPTARDSSGRRIGEFAYAALDDVSDFALVRLDPGVGASPQVCLFGGPTGLDTGPLPPLSTLQHVGRGSLTGSLAPGRTQLALDSSGTRVLTGLGVASPGDSGSPVVGPDGRAVGVLVATGPTLALLPTGLLVFSVRIAPEMGRAGAATGLGFDLVTAPLGPG
ncbi:MAG TPA: hypothetical protein VM942_00525 [Acidimicrobiales bacterium]|nr:hypothetical protein [Acidimicrobiales bacterium]